MPLYLNRESKICDLEKCGFHDATHKLNIVKNLFIGYNIEK